MATVHGAWLHWLRYWPEKLRRWPSKCWSQPLKMVITVAEVTQAAVKAPDAAAKAVAAKAEILIVVSEVLAVVVATVAATIEVKVADKVQAAAANPAMAEIIMVAGIEISGDGLGGLTCCGGLQHLPDGHDQDHGRGREVVPLLTATAPTKVCFLVA